MNPLYFGAEPGAPRERRPTICTGCETPIRKGTPGAPPTYAECDRCRSRRVNRDIGRKQQTNRAFNPDNTYREKGRKKR